jgi:hypothetical protein
LEGKIMKLTLILPVVLLAGCATNPQELSNYDVCRFTMGGPHARAAEIEASRRGLNCPAMYSAIAARESARNAATANFIQQLNPPPSAIRPPVNCTSYRRGNTVQTDCH